MTRFEFDILYSGKKIEMDGKTYCVIGIQERFGRVRLQQIVFYYDARGDDYDTYDECQEALEVAIYNAEDDEEAEELADCDITWNLFGLPFWMHYKDIT